MENLSPLYTYRLRLIASGPRFYPEGPIVGRLERLGLILRTGRTDPATGQVEFAVTTAGRVAMDHIRNGPSRD